MEQTEWMIGLVTSFVVLVAVLKSRANMVFRFLVQAVFFIPKYCFYYCAESTDDFDMRISWNSGVFIAFGSADFEYDIKISQNYFFMKKGLDKQEKNSYNRNYFKSPFGLQSISGDF